MQWNGLLGSRWLLLLVCAAGVAVACGDKADDDLFEDGGFSGKRSSGGRVGTGGSSSVNGGAGGPGSGGNGAPGGTTGGAALSTGGKVSGSGGVTSGSGGVVSSGNQSSGGASQGGAKASGGAAVAGSSGGGAVAGFHQGGSSPAEGGAGDPSAGAAGAGAASRTIQIGDLLDAYVDACNPESRMGSEETLSVDSDPCVFEIYIKPASLSDIPSGAKVESALLELQCIDDIGDAVSVHAVTGEWSEASVDWDNRPSVGDEIGSFTPAEGPVVIDVTSLVQDWLAGAPMNGVALVQGPGTDGSDYYSAESNRDEAPRLLVTYTP